MKLFFLETVEKNRVSEALKILFSSVWGGVGVLSLLRPLEQFTPPF